MLAKILRYQAPKPSLWQGRKDSLPGERFFQSVQCVDVRTTSLPAQERPLVILGFACDEGINRNEGRRGANTAPDILRTQFSKLACQRPTTIIDVGNIVCDDGKLEASQEEFAKLLSYCQQQGARTIAFGGGHEIAWAHFQGLVGNYPKLGIINFDAHFDIRVPQENLGTSGTPFWQIHQHCQKNNLPFHYCCLGLQPAGNTSSLWKRAEEWDVTYLTAEQICKI